MPAVLVSLIEVAKAGETIPYSELAALMGLANQSLTPYLMAVYEEDRERDLTLVVVYKGTKYGRFRGECVRPVTPEECQEYDERRERVYRKWADAV